jgi:hypothetical protein
MHQHHHRGADADHGSGDEEPGQYLGAGEGGADPHAVDGGPSGSAEEPQQPRPLQDQGQEPPGERDHGQQHHHLQRQHPAVVGDLAGEPDRHRADTEQQPGAGGHDPRPPFRHHRRPQGRHRAHPGDFPGSTEHPEEGRSHAHSHGDACDRERHPGIPEGGVL